jgi:hypothetical protein
MSSPGQMVGALVGFVAGILIPGGGFALGMALMSIGGTIGGWLDPADAPPPGPLGDLGINSYVRNAPVPIVVGRCKVYGGVIWIGDNYAYTDNEGSSKNPQYVTKYYAEFAVAFSIGPISAYHKFYINDNEVAYFAPGTGGGSGHITATITSILEDGGNTYIYFDAKTIDVDQFANGYAITIEWIGDTGSIVLGQVQHPILHNEANFILIQGLMTLVNPDDSTIHDPVGDSVQIHGYVPMTLEDENNYLDLDIRAYFGTKGQQTNSTIEDSDEDAAYPYKGTAYVVVKGTIGQANSLPTFAAELTGVSTDEGEDDANPVKFIYWFLTNRMDGCGEREVDFNGNPYSGTSTWKTEADFCDEMISYVNSDGDTIEESRFVYSNVFSSKLKGYDLIQDVLQSCRGILYKVNGKWEIKIAKQNEEPIFYFSDFHRETFIVNDVGSDSHICADFSDYPNNYWLGDMGWITVGDVSYSFIIMAQMDTYLDLAEALPFVPQVGVSFFITKDNMTKETFNYMERGSNDMINVSRVEFVNRADAYRNDVAEVVDSSRGEQFWSLYTPEVNKDQTINMSGIKRKSQAMRMAQLALDTSCFLRYTCNFDTDIVGYMLYLGAIVGVSHSSTGWDKKLFRIVKAEENDDLSVKLSLLEYRSSLYGDWTPPFTETVPQVGVPNPFQYPLPVTGAYLYQYGDKIYIAINRPDDPNWSGAYVLIKWGEEGEEYQMWKLVTTTTPTVKLSGAITNVQNYVPFEPSTLYGSFPDTGIFVIEKEQIRYTSIGVNNQFNGCTRGYVDTDPATHAITEHCLLFNIDIMPYYQCRNEDIGLTLYFKFVSMNYAGIPFLTGGQIVGGGPIAEALTVPIIVEDF